jgi:hypothetical protein
MVIRIDSTAAVVDEVHGAAMREFGLVGEPHRDRIGGVARGWTLALDAHARVADVVGLGAVEHEVDRIEGDDRGQQRGAVLAAGHQIAGIDAPVRDASGDRRADLGPFEVELRGVQRRLGRKHLRAGDVQIGLALV